MYMCVFVYDSMPICVYVIVYICKCMCFVQYALCTLCTVHVCMNSVILTIKLFTVIIIL